MRKWLMLEEVRHTRQDLIETGLVSSDLLAGDTYKVFDTLSSRQREVTLLAAQGLSNKQIAQILGIDPETVKTHMRLILKKTNVKHRAALWQLLFYTEPDGLNN